MSGDANMSAYRYAGTRQQSSSLKHSCWQDMVRYFVKGHNEAMGQDPKCRVVPRFVSSNPLSSLRWWEDTFGQEYEKCRVVNWDTVPDLDSRTITCSVRRTRTAPLLIHLTPRHFSAADLRATQRPESKMDRNARRKERQKIHKAQAASGATSGTTGTTSTAPPPTSGTSAPTTPPKSAPTSDKGKSKAKGKRETSADAGKGKSKSNGDSHREKGKARDTHYGKGKGQK